jgi:hypothetical protein
VLTDIPSFRALTDDGVRLQSVRVARESLTQALTRAERLVSLEQRLACQSLFNRRFSWRAIGGRAMAIYKEIWSARRRRVSRPAA